MVRIYVSWLFGQVNILLLPSENRAHDASSKLEERCEKKTWLKKRVASTKGTTSNGPHGVDLHRDQYSDTKSGVDRRAYGEELHRKQKARPSKQADWLSPRRHRRPHTFQRLYQRLHKHTLRERWQAWCYSITARVSVLFDHRQVRGEKWSLGSRRVWW